MAALDDLRAQVTNLETVEGSAIALLNGISKALADAIATGNPAAIQAVADQIKQDSQRLADAVVANTPATP